MTVNITDFPSVSDILDNWSSEQKISFFENTLKAIDRDGIQNVIDFCRKSDFYTAPSSVYYHSNYPGGLLDHSILVYLLAMKYRDILIEMKPELEAKLSADSVCISSLLHDMCKTCYYQSSLKWKKDPNGQWVSYNSYDINDSFPIGHGEKSVILLQSIGLTLSTDEMLAIRYHAGCWDGGFMINDMKHSFNTAIEMCPLIVVIEHADNAASILFEKRNFNS